MTKQWQGLLQNLGQWNGSFVNYSPDGELISEVPSKLSLCLSDDQQSIDLCLNRYPQNQPIKTIEMQFNYPGPGSQILFFQQGAFSQGVLQYSRVSRFGAELSMIWGDRRLRIVQHYPSGADWAGLTLICETRAGLAPSAHLTPAELCGEWVGTAKTLFFDDRHSIKFQTHLKVQQIQDQLEQTLSFEDQRIQSTGKITNNQVNFLDGYHTRLTLLPGGGSSLCPLSVPIGQPFFLEAGWLIDANLRQRLIRRYRSNGAWDSLTLLTERKQ